MQERQFFLLFPVSLDVSIVTVVFSVFDRINDQPGSWKFIDTQSATTTTSKKLCGGEFIEHLWKKCRNLEVSLGFFKVAILCLIEMKNQKLFNEFYKKLVYFGYDKNYFLLYLLWSMFDSITTTLVEIALFYVLLSVLCCSSSCLVLDSEFLLKQQQLFSNFCCGSSCPVLDLGFVPCFQILSSSGNNHDGHNFLVIRKHQDD